MPFRTGAPGTRGYRYPGNPRAEKQRRKAVARQDRATPKTARRARGRQLASSSPTAPYAPTAKGRRGERKELRERRERVARAAAAVREIERRQAGAKAYSARTRRRTARSAPRGRNASEPTRRDRRSPSSEPERFRGRPTAGTPRLSELRSAQREGELKVNREGYVTTPAVRKAAKEIKRIKGRAAKRRSAAPLPGLGTEEARNARTYLRQGEKVGATRKEKLAAVETGLVESGFKNYTDQRETDADSLGVRQERTSIYGTGPTGPTNVRASARRFYHEARTDPGTSAAPTPGLLAQAAQGSAFPEKYDQRAGEAKAILRAYNQGKLKSGERRKLSAAKAKARKLGLKAGQPHQQERIPKKVMTRFKAALSAAKELERAKLPYVWGGGHGDPASKPTGGGLDCSGAVSYVLNKMGAMKGSLVSGDMGQVLEPGPGAVTVFYNSGHTFMRIGNRYFGTSRSNEAGGPGFINKPDLSSYSVGHVSGLGRKVAVAMGVDVSGAGGSFPGMTLSSSGTTATIDEGAGAAKKGEPGFSTAPIRLTPAQKARRTMRKLSDLGVGEKKPAAGKPTKLKELEQRYGRGAV